MGYRFTDQNKWHKDKWFRKLKPNEKLAFLYIIDNCDIAGFYEIDLGMMSYTIGLSESTLEGAIEGLSKKVCFGENWEWLWVRNFIKVQKNLPINPKNNAHKGIINCFKSHANKFEDCDKFTSFLRTHDLDEVIKSSSNKGANKGLNSPTGKGKGKGKGSKSNKEEKKKDDEEFERFWDLYDLKKGKKKARQKWDQITEEDKVSIFENVPIFLTHFTDKQYTPRPRKYLHNRYWEDEGYQEPAESSDFNGQSQHYEMPEFYTDPE